jgi:hypothetical protein
MLNETQIRPTNVLNLYTPLVYQSARIFTAIQSVNDLSPRMFIDCLLDIDQERFPY